MEKTLTAQCEFDILGNARLFVRQQCERRSSIDWLACLHQRAVVERGPPSGDGIHHPRIQNVLHSEYASGECAGVIAWKHRNRPLRDDATAIVIFVDEMRGHARHSHA